MVVIRQTVVVGCSWRNVDVSTSQSECLSHDPASKTSFAFQRRQQTLRLYNKSSQRRFLTGTMPNSRNDERLD